MCEHIRSSGAAALRGLLRTGLCGTGPRGCQQKRARRVRGSLLWASVTPSSGLGPAHLPHSPPPRARVSSLHSICTPGRSFLVLVWDTAPCHRLRQALLDSMQHGPMKATPRPIITTPDICRCFEMGEPLAERFPGDCSLFAHAETEASRAEVTLPHGRGLANSKAKALACCCSAGLSQPSLTAKPPQLAPPKRPESTCNPLTPRISPFAKSPGGSGRSGHRGGKHQEEKRDCWQVSNTIVKCLWGTKT